MFPVNSTSLLTRRMGRAIDVVQRRDVKSAVVDRCGVYNCRNTAGTDLLSAHAFGDAGDLMFKAGTTGEQRDALARAIIADAERKTVANRGRKTGVKFVIWHDGERNLQWVLGRGISTYTGSSHVGHIHFACSFSTAEPPGFDCGDKLPGVAYR